ncbi:MAG: hypothetical protein KIT68_05665 [Phycisphaeraceae bacterium]|nr:hypothetical protein [Phycisphaeraceae bacterium]
MPQGQYSGGSGYVDNRFGWAGYLWDPVLEVYHVRHRVYDPADGRWLQPDPIGHAGGWNLYEYGGGDYANTIDPWGLSPDPFEPNLNPTQSDYRGGFQDVVVDRGRDIFRRYYYRDGQVVNSLLWSVNGNKGSNFSGRQVFDRDTIGWFTTRAQAFAALNNVLQAASVAGHVVLVAEEMVLRIAVTPVDVVWSAAEIAQDPTNLWNWAGLLPVFSAGVKAVRVVVKDAKGVEHVRDLTESQVRQLAKARTEAHKAHDCVDAARLGREGQAAVPGPQNTQRIESVSQTADYRVPDRLDRQTKIIGEIKNVEHQAFTSQLRDYSEWARRNGYTFELWLRKDTRVTKPLQDVIDQGLIVRRTIPVAVPAR